MVRPLPLLEEPAFLSAIRRSFRGISIYSRSKVGLCCTLSHLDSFELSSCRVAISRCGIFEAKQKKRFVKMCYCETRDVPEGECFTFHKGCIFCDGAKVQSSPYVAMSKCLSMHRSDLDEAYTRAYIRAASYCCKLLRPQSWRNNRTGVVNYSRWCLAAARYFRITSVCNELSRFVDEFAVRIVPDGQPITKPMKYTTN